MRTLWYYWLFVEHFVCDSVKQMHEQVDNVCKTKTILDTQMELVRQKKMWVNLLQIRVLITVRYSHTHFSSLSFPKHRGKCVPGILNTNSKFQERLKMK